MEAEVSEPLIPLTKGSRCRRTTILPIHAGSASVRLVHLKPGSEGLFWTLTGREKEMRHTRYKFSLLRDLQKVQENVYHELVNVRIEAGDSPGRLDQGTHGHSCWPGLRVGWAGPPCNTVWQVQSGQV